MNCPKCGVEVPDDATTCSACEEPVENASNPRGSASPIRVAVQRVAYAGFWLRAVAYVIDTVLYAIIAAVVVVVPLMAKGAIPMDNPRAFVGNLTRQVIAIELLIRMVGWVYFASFESSVWQATPGKRLLGLRVTDLTGKRISFARASGRYVTKMVEEFLLFFGFAMAAFTMRKQALHDIVVRTLVLRKI